MKTTAEIQLPLVHMNEGHIIKKDGSEFIRHARVEGAGSLNRSCSLTTANHICNRVDGAYIAETWLVQIDTRIPRRNFRK